MRKKLKRSISCLSLSLIMTASLFSGKTAEKVSAVSNETLIYLYMKNELGLNTASACGALANIYSESGFNPSSSCIDTDGYPSYGICQWHMSRFDSLRNYSENNRTDYTTLEAQLEYLKYEFSTTYRKQYNNLLNYPDTDQGAYDASYYWAARFEVCASRYWDARGNLARDKYYQKYRSDPDPVYTMLTVLPGSTKNKTFFIWNNISDSENFELKIWRNKIYNGDAFEIKQGINKTSCSLNLPAGNYEAVVDDTSGNENGVSNIIRFSVPEIEKIVGDCNSDREFNALDIAALKNRIMSEENALSEDGAADLNNSGNVDVFDLIIMKKLLIDENS